MIPPAGEIPRTSAKPASTPSLNVPPESQPIRSPQFRATRPPEGFRGNRHRKWLDSCASHRLEWCNNARTKAFLPWSATEGTLASGLSSLEPVTGSTLPTPEYEIPDALNPTGEQRCRSRLGHGGRCAGPNPACRTRLPRGNQDLRNGQLQLPRLRHPSSP